MKNEHKKLGGIAAAAMSIAACFGQPNKPSDVGVVPEEQTQQGENTDHAGSPVSKRSPRPLPTATPLVEVDNPAVASADLVVETKDFAAIDVIGAVNVRLQPGAQATVSIKKESWEELPKENDILVARVSSGDDSSEEYAQQALGANKGPQTFLLTGVSLVIDTVRRTISFPVNATGIYVLLKLEMPPREGLRLRGHADRDGMEFLFYEAGYGSIPDGFSSEKLSSSDDEGWVGDDLSKIYILSEERPTRFTVLAVVGDGGQEDPRRNYHFRKFFNFAYTKSKHRERIKKNHNMLVFLYDTRKGIDENAELLSTFGRAPIYLGDSMGGLVVRARRAIDAKKMKEVNGVVSFPMNYLGDITWGTGHDGLMASHMKWARAGFKCVGTDCSRYGAARKIIAHSAIWHNLGPLMLATSSAEGAYDPIGLVRELGYDLLSLGHRSFFPSGKGDLYPNPAFRFPAWYAFGLLKDARLLHESISADDRYGMPCVATSQNLRDAALAVSVTQDGECRYNFIEALERLERDLGIDKTPSFFTYGGYFSDTTELFKVHAAFERYIQGPIENFIDEGWNIDEANQHTYQTAKVRQALIWSQVEQGWFFPSPSKDKQLGDGLANLVTALKLKWPDQPILVQQGDKIRPIDIAALESRKADDVIGVRVGEEVSHADFVGDDTDAMTEITPRLRDLYEKTIEDILWLQDRANNAVPDPLDEQTRVYLEQKLKGRLESMYWSVTYYDSDGIKAEHIQTSLEQDTTDPRLATSSWTIKVYDRDYDLKRIAYLNIPLRYWNGRWWIWKDFPEPYRIVE